MEGFRGTMIFRPVVIGKGTMEESVALAHQTRIRAPPSFFKGSRYGLEDVCVL
jgi:hypothetical protein